MVRSSEAKVRTLGRWTVELGPPDSTGAAEELKVEFGLLASFAIQFVRSRPDLVPATDHWIADAPPHTHEGLSAATIRGLLDEAYGRDVGTAIAWIDPTPVRHNPLTQVHFARTAEGRDAMIKVLRPNAADTVARESPALLRAMRTLANRAGQTPQEAAELERALQDWLAAEIDPVGELGKLKRLYDGRPSQDATYVIPRPRPDLCGPQILTFEVIRGIPLGETTRVRRAEQPDRLDAHRLDRADVASSLVRSILHQMFDIEQFVVSIDPSNIMALGGNRVAFTDFCHIGRIDPLIRRNQFRYVAAIRAVDTERMLSAIDVLAESPTHKASESFAIAFHRQMREWERDEQWVEAPERRLATYLLETTRLARAHGLRLNEPVSSMVRTLIATDLLAKDISPDSGLGAAAPSYFSTNWLKGFLQEVRHERLPNLGFDLMDLLTDSPGNFVRVLSDMAEHRFVLRVQTVESKESRLAATMRTRLLATSGLFVGICTLGAALWLSSDVSWLVSSVLTLLFTIVLVAFGVLWWRLK